jgi:hypothetical protein
MKHLLTLISFLIIGLITSAQTKIRYMDYNEVHIQLPGGSSKLYVKNATAYRTGAAAINNGNGELLWRNVVDSAYVLNDSTVRVLVGGVIYPLVVKGGKHNLNWGTTYSGTQLVLTNAEGGTVTITGADGVNAGLMTVALYNTLNSKISSVTAQYSITGDGVGSPLQLDGDAASPGNLKYYGTNGVGTRGFFDLPGGGGTTNMELTTWSAFQASSGLSTTKL